jgi:hypothetical protein
MLTVDPRPTRSSNASTTGPRGVGDYFLTRYRCFRSRSPQWGATPVVEHIERREDVRSIPVAQETPINLPGSAAAPREVQISTDRDGSILGQALPTTPVTRGFSASMCLVTSVNLSIVLDTVDGVGRQCTIEAIESEIYQGNYLTRAQDRRIDRALRIDWVRGGGGGSAARNRRDRASSPHRRSRQFSIEPSPAAWLPFADYVPFVAATTFAGRVRADCYARRPGVSVQVRLFNVTDGTVAALGPVITSTTPITVAVDVAIVAGKTYRPEVLASVDGEGAFAIGSLETV